MTAVGRACLMPAGSTLGQLSTHLPHSVQASSMSPMRSLRARSKLLSPIGCKLLFGGRTLAPFLADGSLSTSPWGDGGSARRAAPQVADTQSHFRPCQRSAIDHHRYAAKRAAGDGLPFSWGKQSSV